MDSDSSVDRVEVDGRLYRLKCDCCKSKRTENEYDFHPCKVENCTFAICWSCLQRWKDQSDKDVTKNFECPQCHTEYDTKLIEEHKPLSAETICKVNAKAKAIRKWKAKRKKKHRQEVEHKKAAMAEQQKYLKERREQMNHKRNAQKKKKGAAKNNVANVRVAAAAAAAASATATATANGNGPNAESAANPKGPLHVLSRNTVRLSLNRNLILKSQWSDKMIADVFGAIGPIAAANKTEREITVEFKRAHSERARRVLLYLFNLCIVVDDAPKTKGDKTPPADCFYPSMPGGKREFLKHRDKNTNWSEPLPSYGSLVPPGCKRWVNQSVARLSRDIFLKEMHRRATTQRPQPQIVAAPQPQRQQNAHPQHAVAAPNAMVSAQRPPELRELREMHSRPPPPPQPLQSAASAPSVPSLLRPSVPPTKPTSNAKAIPIGTTPLVPSVGGVPFIPPHRRIQNKPALQSMMHSAAKALPQKPPIHHHSQSVPGTFPEHSHFPHIPSLANYHDPSTLPAHHSDKQFETGTFPEHSFPPHAAAGHYHHNNNGNGTYLNGFHPFSAAHPVHPHSHSMASHAHSIGLHSIHSPTPSVDSLPPLTNALSNGAGSVSSNSPYLGVEHKMAAPPGIFNLKRGAVPNGLSASIPSLSSSHPQSLSAAVTVSSATASVPGPFAAEHGVAHWERQSAPIPSKMAKIHNILKGGTSLGVGVGIHSEPKYKKRVCIRDGMSSRIRWRSEGIDRTEGILVVSDEEDLATDTDDNKTRGDSPRDTVSNVSESATTVTNKTASGHSTLCPVAAQKANHQLDVLPNSMQNSIQNSVQNSVISQISGRSMPSLPGHGDHDDHDGYDGDDGDYDYSDSDEPAEPAPNRPVRAPMSSRNVPAAFPMDSVVERMCAPPPKPQKAENRPPSPNKIEGMTIQRMLDNLDNLESHEVDAILDQFISKTQGQHALSIDPFGGGAGGGGGGGIGGGGGGGADAAQRIHDDHLDLDILSKLNEIDIAEAVGDGSSPRRSPPAHDDEANAVPLAVDTAPKQNGHSPPRRSKEERPQHPQSPQQRQPQSPPQSQHPVHLSMERHRGEMEAIGTQHDQFNLAQFHMVYSEHFGRSIKAVYGGKVKELIIYFNDIFQIDSSTQTVVSLIFDHNQFCTLSNRPSPRHLKPKKTQKVWTPKNPKAAAAKSAAPKKSASAAAPPKAAEEESDFRNGPSAMYSAPRTVPVARHFVVGQTAAVGTANAYGGYGSAARPYHSTRRQQGYGGERKVKNYGDYEDELPHTPSGSEEDE